MSTPETPAAPVAATPMPAQPGAFKTKAKQVLASVVAAVTSPAAVKQEKSLATLVVTRVLLAAGASAGLVGLVLKLAHLA